MTNLIFKLLNNKITIIHRKKYYYIRKFWLTNDQYKEYISVVEDQNIIFEEEMIIINSKGVGKKRFLVVYENRLVCYKDQSKKS